MERGDFSFQYQLKMSQELTEVFHKVDADGSGSVTVEEFKNAVKSSKTLMQKVTNTNCKNVWVWKLVMLKMNDRRTAIRSYA